jgi:hypothetical protein
MLKIILNIVLFNMYLCLIIEYIDTWRVFLVLIIEYIDTYEFYFWWFYSTMLNLNFVKQKRTRLFEVARRFKSFWTCLRSYTSCTILDKIIQFNVNHEFIFRWICVLFNTFRSDDDAHVSGHTSLNDNDVNIAAFQLDSSTNPTPFLLLYFYSFHYCFFNQVL